MKSPDSAHYAKPGTGPLSQHGPIESGKKCRRPVSRILSPDRSPAPCHLSAPVFADGMYLPTPPGSAGAEQTGPICLLTGMYMAFQPTRFIPFRRCRRKACALTTRFHPYPGGRYVSVTLSVSRHLRGRTPAVSWCGALRCPDFPPPPWKGEGDREAGDLQRYTI